MSFETKIASRLLPCVLMIAVLVAAPQSRAQQADSESSEELPTTQGPIFTETVEVNVINLYVTVVDRKGKPVMGLTADDFVVEDGGRPVEITNFSAVGSVATGIAEPEGAAGGVESTAADSGPLETFPSSRVAVVFDNPGLEKRQRKRVLKALYPWVHSVTGHQGQILVAVLEPELKILQPFTTNPALVVSAFEEVAQRDTEGDMNKSRKRVLVRNMQSAPSMKREANIYQPPEIGPGGTYNPGGSSSGGAPSSIPSTFNSAPGSNSQQAMQYLNQIEMYRRQEYVRIGETLVGMDRLIRGLTGLPGRKDILWVTEDLMMQPGVDVYGVFYTHFEGLAQDLNLDQPQIWGTELQFVREFQYISGLSQIAGATIHVVDASDRDRESASTDFKTSELSAFDSANPSGPGATGGYDMSAARSQSEGGAYLSTSTGGSFFGNSRNFENYFATLSEVVGAYYSIGYGSPGPPDGTLHAVSVRVRRDDLQVRTHERVADSTRDQVLSAIAISRLLIDEGPNPLGLDVSLGPSEPAEEGRFIQEIRLQIPAHKLLLVEDGPNHVGTVSVAVVASDVDGNPMPPRLLQLTITLPTDRMTPGAVALSRLRLMMEEGSTEIAVAVRDEGSGAEASARVTSAT